MPTNPTIAITGASGFIGAALVDYFAQHNWRVVALVRNPDQQEAHPNVEYRHYDLTQTLDGSVLKGVTAVVHTAYIKSDAAHPRAQEQNVTAAQNLLTAARSVHVKHIVFLSSMSASAEAISEYGKQKYRIEQLFSGNDTAVMRLGLVIGNGGLIQATVQQMARLHCVPLIAGGRQPIQVIALSDLTQAILLATEQRRTGSYTLATSQVYTYRELYKAIADHLHIRVFQIPVPRLLLVLVFRTAALLRIPLGANEDNLNGLRALRDEPTRESLKALGITLKSLEDSLAAENIQVMK